MVAWCARTIAACCTSVPAVATVSWLAATTTTVAEIIITFSLAVAAAAAADVVIVVVVVVVVAAAATLIRNRLDLNLLEYPYTWLTCLTEQKTPLNNVQVALITIHWNMVYKHMIKHELYHKTFKNTAVMKEYLRTVAHRIFSVINQHHNGNHNPHTTRTIQPSLGIILPQQQHQKVANITRPTSLDFQPLGQSFTSVCEGRTVRGAGAKLLVYA
eukprot:6201596-Pleurochrysis_carterae.AAC.1